MADGKIFAGHGVRRLRRRAAMTQGELAARLGVSVSYVNLVERNGRPLTATLLMRLAEVFDIDPRRLTESAPAGGVEGLRRRLTDPMFADLEIDRHEIAEWLAAAPGGAEAFARAFDARGQAESGQAASPPATDAPGEARAAIEHWRNHFADLDAHAEGLADELRMGSGDLSGALVERLRVKHQLTVRVMPVDVMPDRLRRLDLHARQLQLSELLDGASRGFAAAFHLGQIEAKAEIDALTKGANLSRPAERLFRRHLASYWAAALVMPYGRFLRACEATGYDVELLQRRFGAGFEQVAHRLTTLGRVGARGLPFFMLRIDRAGQVSKRYVGASGSQLAEARGRCPLWNLHGAFEAPGTLMRDLVELEDPELEAGADRWFTLARTVSPQGGRIGQVRARFVVALGVDARLAGPLAAARGLDLAGGATTRIGLGCGQCTRPDCPQRAAPPASRPLVFNERERGVSPFEFAGD